MDPEAWRNGHDPQLEKAIQVVLQEMKDHPQQQYARPQYPNYHKSAGPEATTGGATGSKDSTHPTTK